MHTKMRLCEAALFILAFAAPLPALTEETPSGGPPRAAGRERWEQRFEARDRRMPGSPEMGENAGDWKAHRLGRMGAFLRVVQEFQDAVQKPEQAAGLAAMGIKDGYKRLGKPLEAVPVIDEALKSAKDQKMRNILLFALRQIYEENKNEEKFLEVNKQILRENLVQE